MISVLSGLGDFSLVDTGKKEDTNEIYGLVHRGDTIGEVKYDYEDNTVSVEVEDKSQFRQGYNRLFSQVSDYVEPASPFHRMMGVERKRYQSIGELLVLLSLFAKIDKELDYSKGYHILVATGDNPFKQIGQLVDIDKETVFDLNIVEVYLNAGTDRDLAIANYTKELEDESSAVKDVVAEVLLYEPRSWEVTPSELIDLFGLEFIY